MSSILFDHQTFSLQKFGGISRSFANIHYAVKACEGMQSNISILHSENDYIYDTPGLLGKTLGNFLLPNQKKIYKWNKKYSKYLIRKNDFDVFHPTYYDPYFLKYIKKPFVLTVHDMIHERFPEFFQSEDVLSMHKRMCIEKANHIIAISQSTKDDIQYYLNIPDHKISVIHHGFTPFFHSSEITSKSNNYLLYVGDRNIYKNFYGFIQAITPLLKKNPSLKIICAGGGNFKPAENEFLHRQYVVNQVYQEDVTDEKLAYLYTNAKAFIFPSLYEGFGLPLLEAFNYNCPVITSNTSCFKEICNDAAIYFDPYDLDSIRTQIEAVIYSAVLADDLRVKGKKRLLNFSIENCVDKTIRVYNDLV